MPKTRNRNRATAERRAALDAARARRIRDAAPLIVVDDAWLRLPTVMALTGYGCTSIYVMMERGLFPPGTKISANVRAWRSQDVRRWLQAAPERRAAVVSEIAAEHAAVP